MIRCAADDRWLMADVARDWKIGYELFTLRNYYCTRVVLILSLKSAKNEQSLRDCPLSLFVLPPTGVKIVV
jgi:hypothetical protein